MATDLLDQVRGVNPVTGASPGFVESVAADTATARLAIALRTMPVGSFQAVNGDLRTVEASCRAAVALRDLFKAHGLDFKTVKADGDDQLPRVIDDRPEVVADDGRNPDQGERGDETDAELLNAPKSNADQRSTSTKQSPAKDDPHVSTGTQPENRHVGTDDDVARAKEQEALTAKGGSEHPVTTSKGSTSAHDVHERQPDDRHKERDNTKSK